MAHPIRQRVIAPLKTRWDAVAQEAATRRLEHAYRGIPAATLDDSAANDQLIARAVLAWCRAAPVMIFSGLGYLGLLLAILVNVGNVAKLISEVFHGTWRLITGQHRTVHVTTGEGNADKLDPLGYLADKAQSFGAWVWGRWNPATKLVTDPAHPAVEGVLSLVVLLLVGWLLFLALRAVWAQISSLRSAPPSIRDTHPRQGRRRPDPHLSAPPSILTTSTQHLPVLVLLKCIERVGSAHQRWGSGDLLDAPRVTFPDAERVIWNAWKTRHVKIRRPLRRRQKEHAAKVVGALRAAEERQHSEDDTGMVLEDIALMLLTIASRYAEGRTGELLDSDQLDGVTPATNFAWIRLMLFGSMTIVAGVGCAVLGVPTEAVAPAMGLVLLVGSKSILGFRLGATETIDLFRGK